MRDRILEIIKANPGISFVELVKLIPEIEQRKSGEMLTLKKFKTIMLWGHLTKQAKEALEDLLNSGEIELSQSSLVPYMRDGCVPYQTLAKKPKHYRLPRWMPAVLITKALINLWKVDEE